MQKSKFTKKKNQLGYISADPLPSQEELTLFYREKYYQTAEERTSSYQIDYTDEQLRHKRLMADQIIYAAESHVDNTENSKTLIDVGCGEGFALNAAFQKGWDVSGIEFNDQPARKFNAEIADTIKVGDAYELLQETISSKTQVDVCILTNVLEHVIDPQDLLQNLGRLLRVGGVAVITVPNDYSKLQNLLMERGVIEEEYWFSPPAHLHYFNVESLMAICEFANFEVCEIFAGFPVELFLANSSSNYITNREAGKAAHQARVMLDLVMAEAGMDKFHEYSKGLAGCDMGRTITCVIRKSGD